MTSLCGCTDAAVVPATSGSDALFVGLEGSGKTLLTRRLQCLHDRERVRRLAADTCATIGMEIVEAAVGKGLPFRRVVLRELGGSMAPIWPDYYEECQAVAFVVDVSDRASLAPATVELYELLQHAQLKEKPCAVVLNKCDAPNRVSRADLELAMNLADLEQACQGRLTVLEASALTGQGVVALMDWIVARKCKSFGVVPPPPSC